MVVRRCGPSGALALALAAVACRDPEVGPPPRLLGAEQSQRVARRLLKERPSPPLPSSATLGGGKIRFLGSQVRPEAAARGAQVRVSHYFECLSSLDKSWKMFVHVESSTSPGILVNADHVPVEGLLPTDRWRPGQIIEDEYTFQVPAEAPAELVGSIGFYRFDDRLPVDDPAAHDGKNRIPAFRVKVAGEEGPLPTYRAPRRRGAIAIDGDLSDEGWRGVPITPPFARSHDGGPARFRTQARLAWDDEALYVGWDAEDDDVWAKLEKRDDPIYQEEVVEVFIDADGDGRTYDELELSPRNVVFDAFFPERRQGMDLGWRSGMATAVRVLGTLNDPRDKDRGWTAEMRIPVANLSKVPRWPPRAGDRWRMNLYRLEWHSGRTINEGSAFSPPLVGDFHHLPRFGALEFAP